MNAAGELVDSVLRAMHRTVNDEIRKVVWANLNVEYFDMHKQHAYKTQRREFELDFTDDDGTGLWLPSDNYGILSVWDNDNQIEFLPRDEASVDYQDGGYRYYTYIGKDDDDEEGPLFFSSDMTIEPGDDGATTFTCTALTADHTGEYVQFGQEPGFYVLTAAKAFKPRYYGPSLTGKDIIIRPATTERMVILDASGEALDDRTVSVWYWKAPRTLYRESDRICLPSVKALELRVLRSMPEAKERRPVSERELANEIAKCIDMDPEFQKRRDPRDVGNQKFRFNSKSYYETR